LLATSRNWARSARRAFSMLVDDRETAPELSEARRFVEAWERRASAELRAGSPGAVDAYLGHGRVADGNREEMLAACYAAWKADADAGKSSLMLAVDNARWPSSTAWPGLNGWLPEWWPTTAWPCPTGRCRGGRCRRDPAQRPPPTSS